VNFSQWFGFSLIVIALCILWQIRNLLLLIFTAVVLATALNHLINKLQSLGVNRKLAILFIVILTIFSLIIFWGLIVPPFVAQLQKLIDLLPTVWRKIDLTIEIIESKLPPFLPDLPTRKDLISQIPSLQELLNNFIAFFSDSLIIILQLLLIVALTLMMLANPQRYRQAFISLFPAFYRRRVDYILSESEIALGNWLSGIVVNCLFIGISSGIGLAFLGIPLVLVHAILAGLLNFIPNIGPAASVVFPLMMAVLEAPWKILAVVIWYFIIQNIETYWLSPLVMAKQVSLLPAITLTAQIFFAQTFGILGLLLALPLTVVAKIWLEEAVFKDILDRWKKL
jgi:predicted PurR-regulated permease PerM